jgi:hypothetical protein
MPLYSGYFSHSGQNPWAFLVSFFLFHTFILLVNPAWGDQDLSDWPCHLPPLLVQVCTQFPWVSLIGSCVSIYQWSPQVCSPPSCLSPPLNTHTKKPDHCHCCHGESLSGSSFLKKKDSALTVMLRGPCCWSPSTNAPTSVISTPNVSMESYFSLNTPATLCLRADAVLHLTWNVCKWI